MSGVLFGVDRAFPELSAVSRRIGLATNDAARTALDPNLPSRLALQRRGVNLVRLFSPEHGIAAFAPDGAAVADQRDPLTSLPIVSLYGDRFAPRPEDLADLDEIWFDIPDIGARFYTYIWTLWHLLQACIHSRKPLVVLDRPNPLSGDLEAAEGPILDVEHCASFLGRAAIPIRHSLTVGELARLWAAEFHAPDLVHVVECTGWRRSMHWPNTNLPFVPTSPAMPGYFSALAYPGTCLFEATNLSVGRGTTRPFQSIAAPWLNPAKVAPVFDRWNHPGVRAVPAEITPSALQLLIESPRDFRPVATGLQLLAAVIASHPNEFRWADYPTAANPSGQNHFDRLIGDRRLRAEFETNPLEFALLIPTVTHATGWAERVKPILIYS